jgi:hypothetical protein
MARIKEGVTLAKAPVRTRMPVLGTNYSSSGGLFKARKPRVTCYYSWAPSRMLGKYTRAVGALQIAWQRY